MVITNSIKTESEELMDLINSLKEDDVISIETPQGSKGILMSLADWEGLSLSIYMYQSGGMDELVKRMRED
jgi:hypothetical protein